MNVMQMLAGAAAVAGDRHALTDKHRRAPKPPRTKYLRRKAARRADRAARERRSLRMLQRLDELRGQINLGQLKPVHPRDRYWYDVGLQGGVFTLEPPNGGGSYYARYRAMYEAGAKARREAQS